MRIFIISFKFNTLVPFFILCECFIACNSAPSAQQTEVPNLSDSSFVESGNANASEQKVDSQIVINKIEAVAKITPPPIPTIREIDDEDIDDEGLFVPVIICPTPKNTMGVNVKDWDEPTKIQGIRYPEPNSFVSVDNEPEILNLEEIKQKIGYPSVAKDLEIEGTVIAKVLVDNTGKYIRHVFESSADKYLTKAVNNELPYLKFKPATKDGVPVAYWLTIPFKFVL